MRKFLFVFFMLGLTFFSGTSKARIDVYPFEEVVLEKRFNALVNVLRCPKCQNNNLADSNSSLAKDLKDIVYEKVLAGESDKQIVDYLKKRYGDFVSYDPPMNPRTWVIWFGPFVVFAMGLYGVIGYARNRKTASKRDSNITISDENKKVLSTWADENLSNEGDTPE